MTELLNKLTSETKDVKQILGNDLNMSDSQIAERFPTLNMLAMIPEGMLESPLVQAMIKNVGK